MWPFKQTNVHVKVGQCGHTRRTIVPLEDKKFDYDEGQNSFGKAYKKVRSAHGEQLQHEAVHETKSAQNWRHSQSIAIGWLKIKTSRKNN